MKRTTLTSVFSFQALIFAAIGAVGCSSDNGPSTYTGGSTAQTGGGSNGGSSGSTASGGYGTGGAGGEVASAGSGNSQSNGGSSGGQYQPACGNTGTGEAIAKNIVCTATDTQLCYKTCGPMNVGFKSETCTGGVYAEGTCEFPADGPVSGGDYSCFQVPTADDAACPTTAPQHNSPCDIATCALPCSGTACAMCGVVTGYLDSKGAAKQGYCVCIGGDTGNKWSCASSTAWPCPGGTGC